MPQSSQHLATITALALERAAFSRPGADGRMSAETLADVEAILAQLQARGIGRGAALGYAFDPNQWVEVAAQKSSGGHPGDLFAAVPEEVEEDEEAMPQHRADGLVRYQQAPLAEPAHPLRAGLSGLMALAEGVYDALTRTPPAPIVHIAPTEVHVPPSPEIALAYEREAALQDTLADLAAALTKLAEAQAKPPPAPIVNVAAPAAPVINVAAPKVEITPQIDVKIPEPKRRKVKVLRDDKGEISGTVEE